MGVGAELQVVPNKLIDQQHLGRRLWLYGNLRGDSEEGVGAGGVVVLQGYDGVSW